MTADCDKFPCRGLGGRSRSSLQTNLTNNKRLFSPDVGFLVRFDEY